MVVPAQSKTKTTPTVAKAAPAKVATAPTTKPKTTTPPPTKTTVAKAAPVKAPTTTTTTTTAPTTTKPKTSEKPTEKKQDNKKQDNKKPEIKKNENNNKKPEYKKPENKNNGKFSNDNKKPFNKETKAESSRDTFSKKFFGNKDKKETATTEPKTPFQKREQPFEKKETAQPYQKKFEIKRDRSTTTESSKDSDDIKIENSFSKNPTFSKAQGLYNKKVEEYLFDFKKNGSRDDQWKEKIQHTGTIRDRISAITLLIQKAPMYRLASLDILINLAAKKSEREREFAINSLKDLFVNSLLPNTKLKRFIERENIQDSKPVELVQWYFEDLLKSRYQAYIRLLEILSKDTVARIRAIATSTVQYLLLKKPEQEEVLLTLLVNKLGDEDGSNAGKAVKLLEKLLEAHPAMKLVVIREIELFLYRPNNSNKAQYNALYYLNKLQVACDKDGTSSVEMKDMSHRLIKLYFTFFTNKSNINSSAITLLIFGIRKAYSITKESTVFEPEQLKSLFKSCRKSTINKVIQTLCLIFEIKQHTPEIANDFYSNLYHTLNRMEKLSQFDQTSFLNLVFRAIKHDDNISRSMAVLKRLIQFSFHQIVSFSAATLILVSELIKFNPIFGTMITDIEKKSTEEKQEEGEESTESLYNPLHHDPVQANAHLSCLWEITLYSIHQHPTISSMANDLLRSNPIKFKGNPTVLFTLSAFLEKFVLSRQKNRKLKSSLNVSKSKIAEQYGMDSDNEDEEGDDDDDKEDAESESEEEEEEKQTFTRPEEQFLKTFGDISNASGVVNKKKGSNVVKFVTDNEEMDKALGYKEDENDSDEDLEDLEAEYSYDDLQASDFDDEEFESEIPKSKKPIAPSTKKSTKNSQEDDDDEDDEEFDVNDEEFASLNNEEFLDSIPDDDDDEEDNGEDLDEDEDLEEEEEEDNVDIDEDEEDFDDEDGANVDTPDFGDEEVEEEDDDVQTPDFGDEDEDDGEEDGEEEEEEDEEKSDFLKSMQNNDAFMDADDFADMLEKSGSSNSKSSYKKKGSKSSAAPPSKKSTPSKQPKKSSTSKRKRF
ncbi:hypothetical protein ACTFIW_006512 [Dictyostelium discoideum]